MTNKDEITFIYVHIICTFFDRLTLSCCYNIIIILSRLGWPWGHSDTKTPNDVSLGALGRKQASYGEQNLYAPTLPNRHYSWDGGTIDTMYGHLGVASFFYELGTKFVRNIQKSSMIHSPGSSTRPRLLELPTLQGRDRTFYAQPLSHSAGMAKDSSMYKCQ